MSTEAAPPGWSWTTLQRVVRGVDGVGDWLLDVSLVDGRWIWSAETDHTGLDESGVAATREEAIAAAEAVVERARRGRAT